MSLKSATLTNITIKQYSYKLRAYVGVFTSLVMVQVLGIALSLLGLSSISGYSEDTFSISANSYSADIVIMLTYIWAFINAIVITTKANREDDVTFVSNGLTHSLAYIAFLVTISAIGAVTSLLANSIIRIGAYFINDVGIFLTYQNGISYQDYGIGLCATFLYILIFGAVGYMIGSLTQGNRMMVLLIPIILFLLSAGIEFLGYSIFDKVQDFYFEESSFPIFLFKTVVTIVICFIVSIVITNRLEVRK